MALVSNILTQVFITLIAVAGVYVLTGLTGMFSLGQAAFMAIGSYASGLLVVKAHMPLVPAIIIAEMCIRDRRRTTAWRPWLWAAARDA